MKDWPDPDRSDSTDDDRSVWIETAIILALVSGAIGLALFW